MPRDDRSPYAVLRRIRGRFLARELLRRFSESLLKHVGRTPYDEVHLIDGNDERGAAVFAEAVGGGIFRKGVWRGGRTKDR